MSKRITTAWLSSIDGALTRASADVKTAELYRAEVLEAQTQPIIGFAEDGTVEFASEAAEQMFGHASGALLGTPLERLLPQSRERLANLRNGILWSIGRRRDGNDFPVRLSVNDVPSQDGRSRSLAIINGLGDRCSASSAVPMLIDCMNDGATIWDHADRLILWNEHALRIYAAASEIFRPGTPYAEFLSCCIDRGLLSCDGIGRDDFIREALARHRQAGGARYAISIGGKRVLVSERRLPGSAVIRLDTDISEQESREIELRAAKEKAEAASRSKSTFLANMSHELRTPLNAVIGFSDILKTELLGAIGNPKYVEYANCISDSGAHLLHLVNYILDLSRIEAGRYELRPEPLAPGELLADVLRLMRISADESKLKLVNAVAGDLPRIVIDRRAIRQVLLNILSNAIKFTPPGGDVAISASVDGNSLAIAVSDTGIGISEGDLPRLTNPFEQAGDVYARTQQGTGLGLAITKQLVELHGGSLHIGSRIGEGTTVTIRLPLVPPSCGTPASGGASNP
jgi:PAS domain S-box-containing protein